MERSGLRTPDSLPALHGRLSNDKGHKNEHGQKELQESPLASFADHFRGNLAKVRDCLGYLQCLEQGYNLQRVVFSETVIMYLAAMCVEDGADNYTVQNLLRRQQKKELIKPITVVLSRAVCRDCDGKELTVRDCIRTLRNKYICHFDNFEDYDIYGNESVGEGKWNLEDRRAMFSLLFNGGHVDDLIAAIAAAVESAEERGLGEIVDGALRMAEDRAVLHEVK